MLAIQQIHPYHFEQLGKELQFLRWEHSLILLLLLAIGGVVGGLAKAMQKVGKHAAQSAIRSSLAAYGLFGIATVIIDYCLNLASPGGYLARYWDRHDKVPNNGRINF